MEPSCSRNPEIQDTFHQLPHGHHFTLHRINLMNGIKSFCANIESMTDNNKTTLFLYSDYSCFDENKNKIILQPAAVCLKKLDPFWNKFHLLPNAVFDIFSK